VLVLTPSVLVLTPSVLVLTPSMPVLTPSMLAQAPPGALLRKRDAPELGYVRATNPVRRRAIVARTLAIHRHICHLNRQSPRGRFGWLCVTNNGDCLCDDHMEGGFPSRLPITNPSNVTR